MINLISLKSQVLTDKTGKLLTMNKYTFDVDKKVLCFVILIN